jgi:hypothetical protein
MRREIPLIITAVVGFAFLVQYFVPHRPFGDLSNWFSDWFSIVQACAIVLGVLNLLKVSIQKIAKLQEGWWYAAVTVVSFFIMAVPGLLFGEQSDVFQWLYRNAFIPLSATMFSLLAFFVASASYRAFRARSFDATLLLLAAFFVMLGRVPVGEVLSSWLPDGYHLADLASWVMNVPQAAGQRAIMIGIGLGVVSTSLRVILGIERTHVGSGE